MSVCMYVGRYVCMYIHVYIIYIILYNHIMYIYCIILQSSDAKEITGSANVNNIRPGSA